MFIRLLPVALFAALVWPAPRADATTLTVTNLLDNPGLPDAGSLRERYGAANTNDVIVFAANLDDGVLLLEAPLVIAKSITIDATSLTNGITLRGSGSRVILVGAGVTAQLTGFTVAYGYATVGGGGIENGGTLTLERMTVRDSISADGGAGCGGGICNQSTGVLTINNSKIIDNVSFLCGGGIGALDGGTLTVTNSLVAFNRSHDAGGGICVRTVSSNATIALTNVTITENSAGFVSGSGDGVAFVKTGAGSNNAIVRNCTVAYNTGSAYGLVTTGTMSVGNTIAYGNSFPDIGAAGGTATSIGNNLYGTQSGLAGAPGDLVGDPRLSPLGAYGGPTLTYALLPGSPAINTGSAAGAPSTDQRGITRSSVDIGAFESRGFTLTLSGNNQRTLVSTAYAAPLGVNVTSAAGEPVANGRVTLTPPGSGARLTSGTTTLTIDTSGEVSHAVTANAIAGAFNVNVSAAGAPSSSFSLTNLTGVSLSPTSVPNATAGSAYTHSLTASGGTAPYSYVVTNGALPPGLALTVSGTLSGTPTTAGAYNFTVTAEDSSTNAGPFSASRAYALNVGCPTITVGTLPDGVVGATYSTVASASPPASYTWSVSAGALPSGLSLGPSGAVSGVAFVPATTAFNLQATAFGACNGVGAQALRMACAQCEIGGACVAAAALDPMNDCAACDPFASVSAYSPRAAGVSCMDDGLQHTADRCDGAGGCVHESLGLCEIASVTYAAGSANPGNECQVCVPASAPTGWTNVVAGTPCASDALSCTADICDANGSCVHPVSGGCFIGSACVAPGALDPLNDCAACDPFTSVSAYSPRAAGVSCADDGLGYTADRCDGAGVCLHESTNVCEIDGVIYAPGADHPSDPCLVCAPAKSETQWSTKSVGTPCTDDGDECTADVCSAGVCAHPSISCGSGDGEEPTTPNESVDEETTATTTKARTGCHAVGGEGIWILVAGLCLRRRRSRT